MDGINFNLDTRDLFGIFNKLRRVCGRHTSYFRSKTRSAATQSFKYIQGKFIEQGRGNMTEYAKVIPGCNNQSLQNAVSESSWDVRPVIDRIRERCDRINRGSGQWLHSCRRIGICEEGNGVCRCSKPVLRSSRKGRELSGWRLSRIYERSPTVP